MIPEEDPAFLSFDFETVHIHRCNKNPICDQMA